MVYPKNIKVKIFSEVSVNMLQDNMDEFLSKQNITIVDIVHKMTSSIVGSPIYINRTVFLYYTEES